MRLQDIKTRCLTVPWMTERHARVTDALDSIGIDNWDFVMGEKTTPYTVGLAKAHLETIANSIGKGPLLVLEDDVVITPYYTIEQLSDLRIPTPPHTDAIYIGSSTFGRLRGQTHNNICVAFGYSDKLYKILNMLSLHAVIYLSDEYKKACVDLFLNFTNNPVGGVDDAIADNMKRFNIFSLVKPIFYQKDGHGDEATLRIVQPMS